MSDVSASAAIESDSAGESVSRGEVVAKYLVAFILLINVCFAIYLVTQFFVTKPYGNGLHAVYLAIVLATTFVLGFSTSCFWTGKTRRGTYAFFAAIAVSFAGSLVASLFV
ncbi:MAG: hypothetical protein KDB00_14330 [Planctomycetales bacterium]|nr:hypothetical protein [Planctomycetales bacterium]